MNLLFYGGYGAVMKISNKIEVCNLALQRIRQASIASLEGDSFQAESCSLIYEQSRSSLLSQYNWTFAIKKAKLVPEDNTDDVLKDYTYRYALPNDFLKLFEVYDDKHLLVPIQNVPPPYVRESNKLLTNSSPCILKYICDLENVSEFSPMFIDCLSLDIAIRLVKSFLDSTTYEQLLTAQFQQVLAEAKINDCQQTLIPHFQYSPLLAVTMGSF